MTPTEYEILRMAMFGTRSLHDWSDEELSNPDDFINWAINEGNVLDLPYPEPTIRKMLAEVFEQELDYYKNEEE